MIRGSIYCCKEMKGFSCQERKSFDDERNKLHSSKDDEVFSVNK